MNVLLVRAISDTYIVSPPIGLGYLATSLRRSGYKPKIIDCVKDRVNFDKFEHIIKENNPDVVGFQVWSCDLNNVNKSLKIIKKILPKVITVVGGAHPSGVPFETLNHLKEADFAFKGEAETGLPLLLDKLSGKKKIDFSDIPGLIWRNNGEINVNPAIFIDDLDRLGIPAWDLIDPRTYPLAPHQGFSKAFPIAPIVVTRGCPFSCVFCATHSINGAKIRTRSLESVINEIKLLKNQYDVKEIHIEDDNFTFNREFVKSFCQRLVDEKLNIFWYCSSGIRLDSIDKDTLFLMKKAGCYTLTVAIESGVQRVLDLMKKNLKLEKIREKISLMNAADYKPTGLFMIGFPGETIEEIKETICFSLSLGLKRAQFAIFHPLPGSEIFEELKNQGRLNDIEWDKVKPSEVAYQPKNLSKKRLKGLQRIAFLRFHLRPRIFWYQIKELNSLNNTVYLIKRIIDMFGLNLWKNKK